MKRALFILLSLAVSLSIRANHWVPNPYQFANNMNVIAVVEINGTEQNNANLELGAFCDGECRGSEMLSFYPNLDRFLIFLTLYGQYGHEFDFRLYDHGTEREYDFDCENLITFVPNQIIGSLGNPYVFSFTGDVFTVSVNVVPENGGTSTGGGMYFGNEQCLLTAIPNQGFRFVEWQENGLTLSTEIDYGFTVESDHDITAVFERDGYTIDAEADPAEGGTISGTGFYDTGTVCTLTAIENVGYSFINWTEGQTVVSEDPTISFNVESNRRLVAHFEHIVYHIHLEINPEEGGAVMGDGDYHYGDTARLQATAAPDFYFIHWEEDGEVVSTSAEYSFAVDSNHDLTALFALDCYLVEAEVDPAEGGSVIGAGNYINGTSCTLEAEARQGYAFVNWTENGEVVSTQPSFSFIVEANHHLVAHFEHVVYHITISAEPEIGGAVIGGGDFFYGETCVVEAFPAHNYDFDRWRENGGTVSVEPTFSFVVVRDRDLVAHFVYFDGVEEEQNAGYCAYCEDNRIVVLNPQGEKSIPKMVCDLQGRNVSNNNLAPGIYLVRIEGTAIKVVVRR